MPILRSITRKHKDKPRSPSCRGFRVSFLLCGLLAAGSFCASCSDDNGSPAQSYRMDFVKMLTESDGRVKRMVLDTGDTIRLTSALAALRPDTAYRCVAVFVMSDDVAGQARVTSYAQIVSTYPAVYRKPFKDPLEVQSIWSSGGYVNITAQVRTSGSGHAFGYNLDSLTTRANGIRTLHLSLYHNQSSDPELFNRTVYLSCPIAHYGLRRNIDSIAFAVNTFSRGVVVRAFCR